MKSLSGNYDTIYICKNRAIMLFYTIFTALALRSFGVYTWLIVKIQFRKPHIFCRTNKKSATIKEIICVVFSLVYSL